MLVRLHLLLAELVLSTGGPCQISQDVRNLLEDIQAGTARLPNGWDRIGYKAVSAKRVQLSSSSWPAAKTY